jgi:CBS domain-containing protein
MKVADILREKGTRIITVRLRESVEVAAKLMAAENIGALVVKDVCRTEGNVVAGMFSERDIVRALVEVGPEAMQMSVERLMSKNLISCELNENLSAVMEKMDQHGIRHLPVLDEHTLIGVISVRDVIHALSGQVKAEEAASAA